MFSLNMVDYPMFSLLLSTWIFKFLRQNKNRFHYSIHDRIQDCIHNSIHDSLWQIMTTFDNSPSIFFLDLLICSME